jgi:tetratricopeptide (TPR) repeat protein
MNYPISVCIIAKNEEKHIGECLRRLKPYGMEIIVADTGSSDRTKSIALGYADRVIDYKWENDFSKARNFCASHASNDWILFIDCDEYVYELNMEMMLLYTQKYEYKYGRINVKNIARYEGEGLAYLTTSADRFYNRRYYEYVHAVNEKLKFKSDSFTPNKDGDDFNVSINLFHVGYSVGDGEVRIKNERKLSTLHGALRKATNRKDKAYISFLLGECYSATKSYQKAIENYHIALDMGSEFTDDIRQICIVELASSLRKNGREEEAARLIQENADLVKSDNFTAEHGMVVLRRGVTIEDLPEAVIGITSQNEVDYDGFILTTYSLIIELYNMFGLGELAFPYEEKCEQIRRDNLLVSGW